VQNYSAEVARKPAMTMTRPAVSQMNSTGMDVSMGRLADQQTP
jgi:hypothetical protein